jgi:hypothetical protein
VLLKIYFLSEGAVSRFIQVHVATNGDTARRRRAPRRGRSIWDADFHSPIVVQQGIYVRHVSSLWRMRMVLEKLGAVTDFHARVWLKIGRFGIAKIG